MAKRLSRRPGPKSLFAGKRRAPVSLTLTPEHHKKVDDNKRRLGVTRADLIGLLIDRFAEFVVLPGKMPKYERLCDVVSVLGGRLERRGFSGPRGETWVLSWGGKDVTIASDGETFPLLDACYASQGAAGEERRAINPAGVAELLQRIAKA